ncbi:hypothetical protein [Chitinophaga agri]|uniref:DUF1735 domain-containing protein n=1 Tax=Chitinophaga agri TaxID=2703787 RepID=A0A6B9ZL55_9BACT|nr:hypothetical protein [Chitinophaga agri]QHS62539.1 hypothetical protein GWR21_24025 [Chitinophaga agri]
MLRFSKVILLAALVLLAACRKGDPVSEFSFASFTAELLALPGTADLDIYVGETKVDSLTAGRTAGLPTPLMMAAGQSTTISFRKAGTDSLVLDTVVNAIAGDRLDLKLAYSPALGVTSFMTASEGNIPADSAVFFLFNQLPVEIQADDAHVDAYLFKFDGVDFVESGISWTNLERNKLHTNQITLAVNGENGLPLQYIIRLKNSVTGEYLSDGFGMTDIPLNFIPGQRQIASVKAMEFFGMWLYYAENTIY